MLTRKFGADLVYTQMFSSNNFSESVEFRNQIFVTCPEDRPLIVQFSGHDPQTLLLAAQHVEGHCDGIDINLGCPQGIAKRGCYGAFLMEELELLNKIVSHLSTHLKSPVSCKSRIYKNESGQIDMPRTIRLYETLINAGAKLITIHSRTRDEKGICICTSMQFYPYIY